MARPKTWLKANQRANEAQQVVSSQSCKPSFPPHPKPTNYAPLATPLVI
jgi:hypothetical protein